MSNEQKYKRGDVVRVDVDLGPEMAHFRAGQDAIVMGSYRDQFGGDNVDSYTLLFFDGGESSWYRTRQMAFLRHGGEEEIARVKAERAERAKVETDLAWIVTNWKTLRIKVPGATMGELMKRIGITDPWGPRGDGITYYANAHATLVLLDPILLTGDLEQVEAFLAEHNAPDQPAAGKLQLSGNMVDTFKQILANGDSNDNEIAALGEALEGAWHLLEPHARVELEKQLREILVNYGYDPDEQNQ